MTKKSYSFVFVRRIEPERDGRGRILEYQPAPRYNNIKSLPLHPHGAGPFCRFKVTSQIDGIGVYGIVEDTSSKVLYIGRCTGGTSTLLKRFNQGYGSIQPRNCFEGGQSTNCRINNLVLDAAKNGKILSLYFHKTLTICAAHAIEDDLILKLSPPWNIKVPRRRA